MHRTLSSFVVEWPVVFDRISSIAFFCASTSFHLMAISTACRCPVGGTRGWCSMAAHIARHSISAQRTIVRKSKSKSSAVSGGGKSSAPLNVMKTQQDAVTLSH